MRKGSAIQEWVWQMCEAYWKRHPEIYVPSSIWNGGWLEHYIAAEKEYEAWLDELE